MRIAVIGLLAAAAAFAQPGPPGRGGFGPGARLVGAEPGRPGRVVKNAPYAAEAVTETVQTLPDGNKIRQVSTTRVYRDSEGRTRREQSLDSLNQATGTSDLQPVIFISDPVANEDYALNAKAKTATKMVVREGRGPGNQPPGRPGMGRSGAGMQMAGGGMRSRSSANVKTESLGRQLIDGVQADGTRTTTTIPAGQIGNEQPIVIVAETWYSPELQTTVLSKRSDPRSGETVYRLSNVSRQEPARTLFQVPVDFKVSESPRAQRPGGSGAPSGRSSGGMRSGR
jgi:hypothetical protein